MIGVLLWHLPFHSYRDWGGMSQRPSKAGVAIYSTGTRKAQLDNEWASGEWAEQSMTSEKLFMLPRRWGK